MQPELLLFKERPNWFQQVFRLRRAHILQQQTIHCLSDSIPEHVRVLLHFCSSSVSGKENRNAVTTLFLHQLFQFTFRWRIHSVTSTGVVSTGSSHLTSASCGRTISSGSFVAPRIRSVTLPMTKRRRPPRPCVAIAITS